MKKYAYLILLLLAAAFLLAACNDSATPEAPTEEPAAAATEESAQEPTAEPVETVSETDVSETVVEAGLAELTALVEHPWQWVSFLDQAAGLSDIADPQNYTIAFQIDGTVSIKADCNMVSGAYTVEGDSLTIELGPSTMAACPPESLSDQYLVYLGGAATYRLEEGQLHIDLMADGGTMRFDPAGDELGVPPPAEEIITLRANPWQWESFTNPVEQFDVETPQNYIATFNDEGTINIKADCNNAMGDYVVDSSSLTIELGPMTMVACSPESQGDAFVQYLGAAAIYFFEDGKLYIDLMADGGTMSFNPATSIADDVEGAMDGPLPEDLVAQLDGFLGSQVYSEGGLPEGAAPGLVLLVDTQDGRYLNAAGVANMEDSTPMQIDDRLEIGSNSKSFTVVLLMQLVEEGDLSLEDPLSKWLPDQAASLPNGDQMTVRQLAHHTTGAWDYADAIIGAGTTDPAKLVEAYTPAELVQYAVDNGTPDFAPGEETMWKYSNTGYILLGMVVEAASGQKLGELYQSRIFDPLGLESAVFIEGVPEADDITTHGYFWTEDDQRIDTTNWNVSQGWAAGGNAMTAADLATYGQALAAGDLFQNPDTLTEMLTFDPAAMLKGGTPYGLGLMDFSGDGSYWGHEGQTAGFQSLWYTNPEEEIVVIALTNSATYSAFSFLNVINILEGDGALPVGAITLLPIGGLAPTTWEWTKFVSPVGITDIDETAGLELVVAKDQSVTINSGDCGSASGAYTVDGLRSIDFDIDNAGITCDEDSLAGQFVQYLNDAASWYFDNGGLVVELPVDSGTMVFEPAPEPEE